MAYKIIIDRNLCIGAGSCVAMAPKAFTLDNEAKAVVLPGVGEESPDAIIEAAKACPVAAISIYEENGKPVYT